jgi:hypothetical protein
LPTELSRGHQLARRRRVRGAWVDSVTRQPALGLPALFGIAKLHDGHYKQGSRHETNRPTSSTCGARLRDAAYDSIKMRDGLLSFD